MLRSIVIGATIAFSVIAARGSVYPVDKDGSYTADIIRHFGTAGNLLTKTATVNPNKYPFQNQAMLNGSLTPFEWQIDDKKNTPEQPTAVLRFTLDRQYELTKFAHTYSSAPEEFQIRVSESGFDSMRTAVPRQKLTGNAVQNLLDGPLKAKYIEYQWFGVPKGENKIAIDQFNAYAAAANFQDQIRSTDGYNLSSLGTLTVSDLTPGHWADSVPKTIDKKSWTPLRGSGKGDAKFMVDLKDIYKLCVVSLNFNKNETWSKGAKIELSVDNINFSTVFDQHESLKSSAMDIPIRPTCARYIRITNYSGDPGALAAVQLFAADMYIGQTWGISSGYYAYRPDVGVSYYGGNEDDNNTTSGGNDNPPYNPVPEISTMSLLGAGVLLRFLKRGKKSVA